MNLLRGITLAVVLVCSAIPVSAHHPNGMCALPEEVLDAIQPEIPTELKMVKLDRADALNYVHSLFKIIRGTPPFDLSKVQGGVFIYSDIWPVVYVGVFDGPKGEICHATSIQAGMHRAVLLEMLKGRA